MSLLVWKGSLEETLLRERLTGAGAPAALPERAPVRSGVALCDGARGAAAGPDDTAGRACAVVAACSRPAGALLHAAAAAVAGKVVSAGALLGSALDGAASALAVAARVAVVAAAAAAAVGSDAAAFTAAAVRGFARARAGFAAARGAT